MSMGISKEELQKMIEGMGRKLEAIQESKCRCEAINKKMKNAAIEAISNIKEISFYKAKIIYEAKGLDDNAFYTCCSQCCNCHFERFSENLRWGF